MSRKPTRAKHPVKATRNTFAIIETLRDLEEAGVTQIAGRMDLPKSSVHNYLSTLEEDGYVVKEGTQYRLGLRFLDFGEFARQQYELYREAKPKVAELAAETGELSNLLVMESGRGVYICRETGKRAVNVDAHTGTRVHLHNTALGKAILAYLPREDVENIIDFWGLPQTTENTITGRAELVDALETIRQTGIAYDEEERLKGLNCVAAPILDNDDVPQGAISVSGPRSRMNGGRFREDVPAMLRDAVNVIELNIAFR